MTRSRLDEAMVRRGLAPSRSRARDAITRGHVRVAGRTVAKAGTPVADDAEIAVDDPALAWVSRAALKLIAGLDAFAIDPAGLTCLDLGASTGGFTQVLLARGAARVVAVDVGHGQLDPAVAADPRVAVFEGLNARDLTDAQVPDPVDLIVADVSFVSLKLALDPALALAKPGARLVALVKPQFEVGRQALGRGGIVRDREAAQRAAEAIADWLRDRGWTIVGLTDSPIAGGDGNREFLLGARRDGAGDDG
ncbi:TlyA family RNA methyltransferase [Microbaculum marinum]|uniref:TlyA family RNA methyltransferase n=1 Tax=Microbaculum marinum TaxID=1764581 RepID=A0AAW9RVU9_9HYPH